MNSDLKPKNKTINDVSDQVLNEPVIWVVGATGYIGSSILKAAKSQYICFGTSTKDADNLKTMRLNEYASYQNLKIKANDFVILTAAISSPDFCSREFEIARKINVIHTSEFIKYVVSLGARLVFFSSDVVYGERNDAFNEKALANPVGEYAQMKHEVEENFIGNESFKAIRLSYVFSREDKFCQYLIGCNMRNDEASLFHPFVRAIVHRGDVVEGVLGIVKQWNNVPEQIINFGGPELLSRIDFAECLKKVHLKTLRFKVTEPQQDFFIKRPRIISMQSPILTKLLGRSPRTLHEASLIEFASYSEDEKCL